MRKAKQSGWNYLIVVGEQSRRSGQLFSFIILAGAAAFNEFSPIWQNSIQVFVWAGAAIMFLIWIVGPPAYRKIGITHGKKLDDRFRSISASTKDYDDRVELVVRSRNPRKWEDRLHKFFSDKQRYYEPLKGNGATEVFVLNPMEVLICYFFYGLIWIDYYFGFVFTLMKYVSVVLILAAVAFILLGSKIDYSTWDSFITSVLQLLRLE